MRHGVKAYENGRCAPNQPAFDPPLADHSGIKEAAQILKERNVRQINSSPLLRCRETAEAVAKELTLRPIYYLVEFREYLGNWVRRERRARFNGNYFDPMTKRIFEKAANKSDRFQSYGTSSFRIFENNFNDFKERIRRLADVVKRRSRYNNECTVTHTVVIENLLIELGCPINKSLINPATVIEVFYHQGKFYSQVIPPSDADEDLTVELSDSEKSSEVDSDEELIASINRLVLNDMK